MSLRDSIKDLRNATRRLDTANFNPQMNKLEKFLYGIKVDKPALPPEDVLKKLLIKYLLGENLDSKDRRNLPFIIYEQEITFNDTVKILNLLDFNQTSHLRRVVSVYLLNYDSTPKTRLLRERLNVVREVDSVSLKKIFAARENLFAENHMANMEKLFAQKLSVAKVIETFRLSNFYKASNFIQSAIVNFFRINKEMSAQFEILDELDTEFDTYKNIFPYIADALIQSVAFTNLGKKKCIEIFYRRLGDPRFGYMRFNWDNVSTKSKEIFLHWLAEDDLETFFHIVAQTTNDKQWGYREEFWRKYLPQISNTWIYFGREAKRLAKRSNLNHGTLKNGNGNQAVFVFQIGRYIFSEWSNVGKVRAHDSSYNEKLFGGRELNGEFIRNAFVDEWTHYPHGGANCWQDKVRSWIRTNC